ncbi:MAG: hypothetical protein J6S74_00330 [Alphaproteobacteria bacterium]|nr:hypothetical protein [Alphaproteobacteria bacterium]
MMRSGEIAFLVAFLAPFAAFAANEGVPAYYQTAPTTTANQAAYGRYQNMGYSQYVGKSGQRPVVGTTSYTYQVPRVQVPTIDQYTTYTTYSNAATMTPNGIAIPLEKELRTSIYAGYSRRFADFQFRTGVNSVLEWDDMIFNEINVGAQHNFSLRNFDLFAYADYSYGVMASGGLSMDYDLEPYDWADARYGIFTISMGKESGRSEHLRLGFGARHVWDIWGWKLSPSIGYEIFKHNLKMSDHLYPNQGIYLPLMATSGDYVYGDEEGNYYTLPIDSPSPSDWYQVCMSPEDIKIVNSPTHYAILGDHFSTVDYDQSMGDIPWGVYSGECVIIGGDGPILIDGTTHIYNTTWSGFYIGLEMEKQMTLSDKLRFYVQFGLPKYSSEGIWPNRDDWQQNPSFLDEGNNGAYSYAAEMEYIMRVSNRLQLALKVDTNYFHVGEIGGELYVASTGGFLIDENGQYVLDGNGNPIYETVPAHTEKITESLESAEWQSFGLHLGVKYAF